MVNTREHLRSRRADKDRLERCDRERVGGAVLLIHVAHGRGRDTAFLESSFPASCSLNFPPTLGF